MIRRTNKLEQWLFPLFYTRTRLEPQRRRLSELERIGGRFEIPTYIIAPRPWFKAVLHPVQKLNTWWLRHRHWFGFKKLHVAKFDKITMPAFLLFPDKVENLRTYDMNMRDILATNPMKDE